MTAPFLISEIALDGIEITDSADVAIDDLKSTAMKLLKTKNDILIQRTKRAVLERSKKGLFRYIIGISDTTRAGYISLETAKELICVLPDYIRQTQISINQDETALVINWYTFFCVAKNTMFLVGVY